MMGYSRQLDLDPPLVQRIDESAPLSKRVPEPAHLEALARTHRLEREPHPLARVETTGQGAAMGRR